MPKVYRRRLGSRSYKNYAEESLKNALLEIKAGSISQRGAAKKYNIARSTLQLNLKLGDKKKRHGGQTVLSSHEEDMIKENVLTLSTFGYPVDKIDLRNLVKSYLDRKGATTKFHDNMPGQDWVDGYLQRHKELTVRFASNIKNARAKVSLTTLNDYFDHLEKELAGMPPENIYNFDESNLTDDPGKKKIITKRGTKYPERIIHSSKTSISIMFCGNAAGVLIPPYVVYKALHLYDTWTQRGYPKAGYNRTKSGWFDALTFDDWFTNLLLPILKKQDGPKAIIGDNLSAHINSHVLKLCKENDIKFICLPPNTTHLTQPLDVAYFRPMKMRWKKILEEYKNQHACVVKKEHFPALLKKLIDDLKVSGEQALRSGFKKCGIYPQNRTEVIDRIPSRDMEDLQRSSFVSDSVIDLLEKKRYGDGVQEVRQKNKKSKLNVIPGKSVEEDPVDELNETVERVEEETKDDSANANNDATEAVVQRQFEKTNVGQKGKKKKIVNEKRNTKNKRKYQIEDSDVDSEDYTSLSEDEGSNWNCLEEDEESEHPQENIPPNIDNKTEMKDGNYVIVKYDGKHFPGQITQIKGNEFYIKTLMKCGERNWKWPAKDDVLWYKINDIVAKIEPPIRNSSRPIFHVPEIQQYEDFMY